MIALYISITVLISVVVIVLTSLFFIKRSFDKSRENDFIDVEQFGVLLDSTKDKKETIRIFAEKIIRDNSSVKSVISLISSNSILQHKIGFNVPKGSLKNVKLTKPVQSELLRTDLQYFNTEILSKLHITDADLYKCSSVFVSSFFIEDNFEVSLLFLLSKKKLSRIQSARFSIYFTQVISRLYEQLLERDSRLFRTSLGEIEESFTHVIEYAPNGFIVIQPLGKISYVNEEAAKIFERTKSDFIGRNLYHTFSKELNIIFKNMINEIITRHTQVAFSQKIKFFSSTRSMKLLDIHCYPITNEESDIVAIVLLVRDRSKQYFLEEELRNTQELAKQELERKVTLATKELVFTNKELTRVNELKSEFVSTISHELRTPLTSIKGYLKLFEAGRLGELKPQQKESVKIMVQESERLHQLINDILDLSKLESGKTDLDLTTFNLENIVKEILQSLKPAADDKSLKLIIRKIGDFSQVVADENKMRQVLVNLVSNAIKFTMKGSIIIKLSHTPHYYCIAVTDSGLGIPKDKQKDIFDPFVQLKEHQVSQIKGTGLGLPIVKNIIDLHKAKIEVSSEVGKGTTFLIHLPKNISLA